MKLCTGIPIIAYHTNIMLNCAALLLLEINYKQGHLWLVVGNPSVTDDVGICCRSLKTVVRRRGSVSLPVILLLIASRRMRRPPRESTLLMMIRSRAARPPVIICYNGSCHLRLFGPLLFVH